ncbi:SDR family NAD(P)-dependent oxidoreductase [Rhodococcus spongiicola]|uniref:SDR family oxidoreductase n=1 Tax=Rhodococcus spongiicola TaxID=2487352 RepID=A0A438B4Z7_9NOCA|nr:SDR family oxidoreductase [Rhodococcus spongiicola]RVW06067.1 SDR family oxidoreductase [Rhodococcus spongiicola]
MGTFDLSGKKALVTGGAQGLGEGFALALAKAGADVVISDIQDDLGKQTADRLAETGRRVGFAHHDVTSEDDWRATVAATVDLLGGFDILVNNAGIEITGLLSAFDPDGWRRMFDVNVVGTGLGIKHAFTAMAPGGTAGQGGVVINVASVAATIAFPGIAGYSASKSAVDRITRIAAQESGKLGYGVRVNCLYPGLVATEMGNQLAGDLVTLGLASDLGEAIGAVVEQTPSGRLGEVSDMASAVVFLASDDAQFINGAGIPVDGGMGM